MQEKNPADSLADRGRGFSTSLSHAMSKERATDPHVLHPKFFLFTYLKFLLFLVPFSQGTDDTLTTTTLISDDDLGGDILLSAGRKFELGFFSPGTSSNRYLGIWYHHDPLTVVWVANRESPLSNMSGVFRFEVNGNLGLSMDGESYWATKLQAKASSNRTAKLMDSGNLVLSETSSAGGLKILWQSFDDPTDTFLPGMVMREDFKLTSWRGPDEPAPGDFTFLRDSEQDNRYIIQRKDSLYWKSGVSWKFIPDGLPTEVSSLLTNSSLNMTSNARLVMKFDGKIQYFTSSTGTKLWNRSWFEPRDPCHQFNFCGNFGICNSETENIPVCRCLPGFVPQQQENWDQGDFSQGCARTSSSRLCGKMNSTTFETLKLIKIGPTNVQNESTDQTQCKEECLADCNCQAYSYTYNRSAATGRCWIWSGDLSFIQEGTNNGHDVYIRKSLVSLHKGIPRHLIYLVAVGTLALVIAVVALLYMWRRSVSRQAKRGAIAKNLEFQLYDSERLIKEWTSSGQFAGNDEEGIKVPFFNMEVVLEATNYFSDENKLGKGGFGPVYKGQFPGGQEIAVKRLSSGSGQGFEEFKNEVLLIARLQHRNLVRLLGYCTKVDEKLLIYEYMPNKSLDSFIFDRTRCVLLNWETRMDIILGVARGMLYLHQDSRLTVIHRDLKVSNILLDEELNPKISDFGLARIFEAKQTEANTNRVIGTYGYMSPEYALDGFFSTKSDVFSFGVVVLEIISGKRNTGFYQSKVALNLLSYAWRLWNEDNAIDLVDPILHRTCNRDEALKCIKLALLCIQSDPGERPTMSNIVFTLSHENVTLPTPRKPAFVVEKGFSCEASSSSGPESYIEISNSLEQGR